MFSFDLENSWGIRRFDYDIWNPCCVTFRLMYDLCNSEKILPELAGIWSGKTTGACSSGVWFFLGFMPCRCWCAALRVCFIGCWCLDHAMCVLTGDVCVPNHLMKHIVSFSWRGFHVGAYVCECLVLICLTMPCVCWLMMCVADSINEVVRFGLLNVSRRSLLRASSYGYGLFWVYFK